jgi:hypothetical protein
LKFNRLFLLYLIRVILHTKLDNHSFATTTTSSAFTFGIFTFV